MSECSVVRRGYEDITLRFNFSLTFSAQTHLAVITISLGRPCNIKKSESVVKLSLAYQMKLVSVFFVTYFCTSGKELLLIRGNFIF